MYIYGYIDKNVINEDDAIDGIVNPYRRDVVAGICTDFRSDAKAKMARGMLTSRRTSLRAKPRPSARP